MRVRRHVDVQTPESLPICATVRRDAKLNSQSCARAALPNLPAPIDGSSPCFSLDLSINCRMLAMVASTLPPYSVFERTATQLSG